MIDVLEILKRVKDGVDYENEKNLVTDGILTSFDLITLVSILRDEYDVEVTVMDFTPENFESIETITALIERLK